MRTFEREQTAPGQYFSRDNLIGALLAGPIVALVTGREGFDGLWTAIATWLLVFAFLGLSTVRERGAVIAMAKRGG